MESTIKSKESIFRSGDQVTTKRATFMNNKGGSKTARNPGPGNGGNIFVFNNQEVHASGIDSSTYDKTEDRHPNDFNATHNRLSIDTDIMNA